MRRSSRTASAVEDALESAARAYFLYAPNEPAPLGTTSFDRGHGLVDVVAAQSIAP